MQITDGNRAPNLLPVTLFLSVVLWLFTMTGGRDIFVNEVLGGAYDSQAEHFLRGDVDVDEAAIGHEAMIVERSRAHVFWAVPSVAPYPAKFPLPSGTREMVANFRILRGRHLPVCLCRPGAHGPAFVPAFIAHA